ncbi:MAG: hypothetical protein IIY77_03520 [Lachnospiraceae bacterium]|nr:hypothetical protein [Lachnospiraceae bacterium]
MSLIMLVFTSCGTSSSKRAALLPERSDRPKETRIAHLETGAAGSAERQETEEPEVSVHQETWTSVPFSEKASDAEENLIDQENQADEKTGTSVTSPDTEDITGAENMSGEEDASDTEEFLSSEEPLITEETLPVSETAVPVADLRDPEALIDTTTTLYTYEKMEGDLHYLAAVYPEIFRLYSAGTTEDGRELYYVIFGNPGAERQIYICAGTHAREYMTPQLVMRQLAFYCTEYETGSYNGVSFKDIFTNTCFYVEPMVNPDGIAISQFGETGLRRADLKENLRRIFESELAAGTAETADYARYLVRWKANARGVDINRNYSPGWETVQDRAFPASTFYKGTAPGSERETQAQMAVVNSMTNPLMAISYHSYGDLIYWQYGQPEPLWTANQNLAQHISNLTGHYLAGYSNEAGFTNWCIIERKIPAVVVETGTVPTPLPLDQFAPLFEKHRYMWAMLASLY